MMTRAVVLALFLVTVSVGAEKDNLPPKKLDLEAYGQKLKEAVKSGKMTKAEAMAAYKKRAAEIKNGSEKMQPGMAASRKLTGRLVYKGEGKTGSFSVIFAVADPKGKIKKNNKGKADNHVLFVGEQFREQFKNIKVGDTIEIGLGKVTIGKAMPGKKKSGAQTFYSIVIGRLKTKDIELGEFTMEVDYVTGIYGDRRLKDTLIGKTVTVVGVSGPWLDKLLLIKRGETIKVRSGTVQGTIISLSPKATVLERAVPFDPSVYPIPPKEFKGFQGTVIGTIASKSDQGYELTLKVDKVAETFNGNKAAKPSVIEGRLLNMRGFYFNETYRKTFDGLRVGDTIRVGAVHQDPTIDALDVSRVFEKVGK